MRKSILPVLLALFSMNVLAQSEPKDIQKETIPVSMFQVTYAFQLPAMDTRTDFGFSHTIGGSFVYKTDQNWIWMANGNFIFGNQVKGSRIDLLGEGVTTVDGEIVGGSGSFTSLAVYERGLHVQAEVGKLFPFKPNPNSGFFVQAGLGYLTNRIRIDFEHEMYNTPYQVAEDYQYGYDRLKGGLAGHLETGYLFLGDSRVWNFSVSLEMTYACTRHLRDYDFRVFTNPETGVMEPVGPFDKSLRFNELYYGIRLSWYIPTYQRQPEAFYFD